MSKNFYLATSILAKTNVVTVVVHETLYFYIVLSLLKMIFVAKFANPVVQSSPVH